MTFIGELEVFHSAMLKYVPKRLHFCNTVQKARTQLAVLDHNENVGRAQATTAAGIEQISLLISSVLVSFTHPIQEKV